MKTEHGCLGESNFHVRAWRKERVLGWNSRARAWTEGSSVPIQRHHFQDRPHGTQSLTWAPALHQRHSSLAPRLNGLRSSIMSRSLRPFGWLPIPWPSPLENPSGPFQPALTCQPAAPRKCWRARSLWSPLCRCRRRHSWTWGPYAGSPWRGDSPCPAGDKDTSVLTVAWPGLTVHTPCLSTETTHAEQLQTWGPNTQACK